MLSHIELTAIEWEWFIELARSRSVGRAPPTAIGHKLVELKLMEEKRGGHLGPTIHGRDVLKLVDGRWRGAHKSRAAPPEG